MEAGRLVSECGGIKKIYMKCLVFPVATIYVYLGSAITMYIPQLVLPSWLMQVWNVTCRGPL